MLSQLHEALASHDPQHGLFVSGYDSQKQLLFSEGSRSVPAAEVLDLVHEHRLSDHTDIHTITLHIVTDVQPGSSTDLKTIDLTTTGIGIHDDEGAEGAILPRTLGIDSPHEALAALKTQANLHGKAHLILFHTEDYHFTLGS